MTSPRIALASPRRRRPRWVPPLMAVAVVCLLAGLWAGLVRLGLTVPAGISSLPEAHGPLMTLGFLGTFIALERAVALGQAWGYVAPAAAGAGGVAVAAGAPAGVGEALLGCGGLALVAIFVAVHRIQPSLHNAVLAGGAICWVVAAGLWLAGWDVSQFVPWLAGFLVLTIAGERLELSRMTGTSRRARLLFTGAAVIFAAGLLASLAAGPAAPEPGGPVPAGIRVTGAGLIALAAWLARYDIARRTVRGHGVTRYMAAALLAGYVWLAVAGGLWAGVGQMADGPAYDAELHAIFLGFVMSMIFAHAPVIVPSVLGRPLPFRSALYVPLVLLQVSLVLRLAGGDWAASTAAWQWGGSLTEVAILLFLGMAAALVVRSGRTARGPGRPLPHSGRPPHSMGEQEPTGQRESIGQQEPTPRPPARRGPLA
ncbi:MAG: hypothetical protein J2P34_03540 [Actinobacteria bacterium]|nr:hypothetical protein [Actinomycetota bacterium]